MVWNVLDGCTHKHSRKNTTSWNQCNHDNDILFYCLNQGCGSGSWKQLNFCGNGGTLKKEAGSGSKLGSIWLFEEPEVDFHKTRGRDMEVVKFLRKHFEERSWMQTRKRLTLYGAGSGSQKYCTASTSLVWTSSSNFAQGRHLISLNFLT